MSGLQSRDFELIVRSDDTEYTVTRPTEIKFNAFRSHDRTDNSCGVQVYNLDPQLRDFIGSEAKSLILRAGYEHSYGVVFEGDIDFAWQEKSGTDWIVTINCGASTETIRSTKINKAYPVGTTIRQIVTSVAQSMSLTPVASDAVDLQKAIRKPYVFVGSCKGCLNDLADAYGFSYNIDGRNLFLIDPDKPTKAGQTAYNINPSNGLVGDVQLTTEGVKAICLLSPQLEPGSIVSLDAPSLNTSYKIGETIHTKTSRGGYFVISKMSHQGDYRGGNWNTSFEASVYES